MSVHTSAKARQSHTNRHNEICFNKTHALFCGKSVKCQEILQCKTKENLMEIHSVFFA